MNVTPRFSRRREYYLLYYGKRRASESEMGTMSIVLSAPDVSELGRVASVLACWQRDDDAIQLHPGDLGWYSTNGADATAQVLRIWSAGQRILAIGLLDGPRLLRMAVQPELRDDENLADQLANDVKYPQRGVLPDGAATIESRGTSSFSAALSAQGWQPDEPWTPLHLDLSQPVPGPKIRVEVIGPDRADDWVSVHWSAFRGTPFTEDARRRLNGWMNMAASPFSESARILAASDEHGKLVEVSAVWSAGQGRPGLLELMGVHRDERGHGYGTAITIAAADNLREMGASSVIVCAENSNVAAVCTYEAAGFTAHRPVADLHRPT
jgi:GNAT superfamily N-acetyltransferase